jgi:nitrogen fixation protein FixH
MKAGMMWPIGITAILGATVAANIVMIRLASDDPSMAIEPNYYKKAVDFDSTMAAERRSNALGWTAVSSIEPMVAGQPTRVRVKLATADGTAIPDATVKVVALFNARANDLKQATLTAQPDSSYTASIDVSFPGLWEVRVDATRGAEHLISTSRVDVSAATGRSRTP